MPGRFASSVFVLCHWRASYASLFVVRWHLILDIANQRHSHLGCIIPSQDVGDKMGLNLHLHLCWSALVVAQKEG